MKRDGLKNGNWWHTRIPRGNIATYFPEANVLVPLPIQRQKNQTHLLLNGLFAVFI